MVIADADNYNLEATDPGDCIYYGCVDSVACNYDTEANTDDNSCWYPDAYYLDCNGDCLSDVDFDGICDEAEVNGCTDINASNYNDLATEEDNSCTYTCDYLLSEDSYVDSGFDDAFSNYYCYEYVWTYGFYTIEEAIANGYACDCVESPVPGCTDDEAINYNPNANQSDNSCEYNCDELGLSTIFINVYGGQYPSEITWSILDSNEDVLIADGVPDMPMQYCLDPNLCYTLLMNDSYGDGWNGNILEITGEQYNNQYTLDNGWFGISLIGDSCDLLSIQ